MRGGPRPRPWSRRWSRMVRTPAGHPGDVGGTRRGSMYRVRAFRPSIDTLEVLEAPSEESDAVWRGTFDDNDRSHTPANRGQGFAGRGPADHQWRELPAHEQEGPGRGGRPLL